MFNNSLVNKNDLQINVLHKKINNLVNILNKNTDLNININTL